MTSAQLVTRTLARIGELASAPVYYTSDEVLSALNSAQRLFCLLTLCLETTAPLNLSAGLVWYHALDTLPGWIAPLRVRCNGRKVQARRITVLDALNERWQAETGTPADYACLGCDLLAVRPHPVAAGVVLNVTYARAPVAMTAAVGPEIPEEYHAALIDCAIPLLRAKEGGQEFKKVQPLFNNFVAAAKKMAAFIRARNLAHGYDRAPVEELRYDTSREVQADA